MRPVKKLSSLSFIDFITIVAACRIQTPLLFLPLTPWRPQHLFSRNAKASFFSFYWVVSIRIPSLVISPLTCTLRVQTNLTFLPLPFLPCLRHHVTKKSTYVRIDDSGYFIKFYFLLHNIFMNCTAVFSKIITNWKNHKAELYFITTTSEGNLCIWKSI